MTTTEYQPTDLDHQGAVRWVRCPMCLMDKGTECASIFMLGDVLISAFVERGKVHEFRMRDWLEHKAIVVAGAKAARNPNLQQVPRSGSYKISEGGTKEAELYWRNRNK